MRRFSGGKSGCFWFWTRLSTLRISNPKGGRLCWSSTPNTDCCWRALPFRTISLNCGLCCISWCQLFSKVITTFPSGSVSPFKEQSRTIPRWVKRFCRNYIQFCGLLSSGGSKRTSRSSCPPKPKSSSGANWVGGKSIYMTSSSNLKWTRRRGMTTSKWWIFCSNSERCAITLSCMRKGQWKVPFGCRIWDWQSPKYLFWNKDSWICSNTIRISIRLWEGNNFKKIKK